MDALDLETVDPQPKHVKLCGKSIPIYPPKLKTLLRLVQASKSQDLEELYNALLPIVPNLKDDDVDATIPQLTMLVEFAINMSTPQDDRVLAQAGITAETSSQKKSSDSLDSSPTFSENTQDTPATV